MSITANYARISGAILRRKACPCLAVAQPGASVWGTGVWGGQDAVLRQIKLKGSGRFIRYKFTEPDINETFNLYGFNSIFWDGDVQ